VEEVLDEVYDYVELEKQWDVAWDMTETNPENLDPVELQQARLVEVERLQRFKTKVSFVEHDSMWSKLKEFGWNGKVWDMRWVDVMRAAGIIRSRVVGRQFNSSSEYGLFASTPDGTILYYLISDLAHDETRMCLVFDVTSAYLHAPLKEIFVLRPPKELRKDPKELWLARKAFPGLRISGRAYQDFQSNEFEQESFERCLIEPCAYREMERGIKMMIHGDDGLLTGHLAEMQWARKMLPERFECNVGQICGLKRHGAETDSTSILKKKICVDESVGWTLEGNEKHATELVKFFNLTDGNPSSTPGSKQEENEDDETPLEDALYSSFRSAAGLALFVAGDNMPIKFAVKEVLRMADKPTVGTWNKLKRVARFLSRTGGACTPSSGR
jgi:hypothetical protein